MWGTHSSSVLLSLSSWKARIVVACYLISAIICQQEKQKYHYWFFPVFFSQENSFFSCYYKNWENGSWPVFRGTECLQHHLEPERAAKQLNSTENLPVFRPPFLHSSAREHCTKDSFWWGSSWHPHKLYFPLSPSRDGLHLPSERGQMIFITNEPKPWVRTCITFSMTALAGAKDPDKNLEIIEL